jgi:hypothetical protein
VPRSFAPIGVRNSFRPTDEKSVSRRTLGQRDGIAHRHLPGVATLILHRVVSPEVHRARVNDDDTEASAHPAQRGRAPARLLRCREVCAHTGLSRTTLCPVSSLHCDAAFCHKAKVTGGSRSPAPSLPDLSPEQTMRPAEHLLAVPRRKLRTDRRLARLRSHEGGTPDPKEAGHPFPAAPEVADTRTL